MNSSLNLALRQTARKFSLDYRTVENVYRSYWKFIRNTIADITFPAMSEDEFDRTNTNFNIPYIGKLYTDYDKIKKYNNQLNYYRNVKAKKNQANRQSSTSE